MSRIHEALKKAEQERASAPPNDLSAISSVESNVPMLDDVNGMSRVAPREYVARPEPGSSVSSDYLRFDDLRKKCAHPTWHLDPNVNMFLNSSEHRARSGTVPDLAFASVSDAQHATAENSAGHQFRPGRGQNICYQQSRAIHRSPAGSPGADHRRRLALLASCTCHWARQPRLA